MEANNTPSKHLTIHLTIAGENGMLEIVTRQVIDGIAADGDDQMPVAVQLATLVEAEPSRVITEFGDPRYIAPSAEAAAAYVDAANARQQPLPWLARAVERKLAAYREAHGAERQRWEIAR